MSDDFNGAIYHIREADENFKGAIFHVKWVGGEGDIPVNTYKTIVLSATIPAAGADTLGKFYCYKGVTNQNYTHGYVYECIEGTPVYTGTVSFEPATLSGTTVACSGDDFANFLTESGVEPLSVVSGTMTFDIASSLWVLVGKDANNETVLTFQEYQQDYEDAGFTFTGTPQDGDVVAFTCTVESSPTYTWSRVNLQPGSEHDLGFFDTVAELQVAHPTGSAGDFALIGATDTFWVWDTGTNAWVDSHKADAVTSVNGKTGAVTLNINDVVPDQTGNAGKFLKSDGVNASWESTSMSPTTPPTLVAADWSSNTQTITVQGVTATNTVIVSPIPTDAEDYAAAGILCTGQATNALTFTCRTTPASDLQVNIVIM